MADLGRIGLVAVTRESLPLLAVLRNSEQDRWGETILHRGQIGGQLVALADVLAGPVNAALGAQALVGHCGVRALISLGSAGALDPGMLPGDLVVAERAMAHDAGVFLGSRFEPAGVMGRDERGRGGYRRHFEADRSLVELALDAALSFNGRVCTGTVVTGNQVVFSTARRRWLWYTFGALAVEMETAAVAQVAMAHRLPWVAVRAISDTAGDEFILDYRRLRVYLDDARPAWRHQMGRWFYLMTHPQAWHRARHLRRGLDLASGQAAKLVETMLRA
jgi:adenosylhomocysteine nucleosidase